MSSFKFTNLKELQKKLNLSGKMLEKKVIDIIVDETIKSYHTTAYATPQYSGYLVSNLRIEIDGNSAPKATELYSAHLKWRELGEFEVRQKADEYAIGIAAAYNRPFLSSARSTLTMDSKVEIKYLAEDWEVAEEGVNLRDVNKPGQALAKGNARVKRLYTWEQMMKTGGEAI